MYRQKVNSYFVWIVKQVAVYGAVLVVANSMLSSFSLREAVVTCKIVSLFGLITVSQEIAREMGEADRDVRFLCQCTNGISVLIVAGLIIRLVFISIDEHSLNGNQLFNVAMSYYVHHMYWIGAFPIVAYAAVNLWAGFVRQKATKLNKVARTFFILDDCVCGIPLVAVLIIAFLFKKDMDEMSVEIFVDGAMAAIIFASNVVTKALDTFLTGERLDMGSDAEGLSAVTSKA